MDEPGPMREDLDEGYVPIGATVSGHPLLSDGVVVHNGGFGQFAFGVPSRNQYVQVDVLVPADDWDEESGPQGFAVADDLLGALGWLAEGEDLVSGEDDLCEQIGEDAAAAAVSGAFDSIGAEWDEAVELSGARSNSRNCTWVLASESISSPGTGPGGLWIGVHRNVWPSPDDVVAYSEQALTTEAWVRGYPGLSAGVAVRADAFDSYAFLIEGTDNAFSLRLEVPGLDRQPEPRGASVVAVVARWRHV